MKSKTPLLDSIERANRKAGKLTKVKPDSTPVLTLTDDEQISGRTIPEILEARRMRGETIPKMFKLAAMPECARYVGGGRLLI